MKIVSPFKDYYDYLVGVYGIDEYKKKREIVEEKNKGKKKKER